jgi:hypothetical protein
LFCTLMMSKSHSHDHAPRTFRKGSTPFRKFADSLL